MTTNPSMIGNRQPPPQAQKPRGGLDSLTQMPSNLITLSPEFVAALRKVAPRVRSRKLPYVLLLAVVATVGGAYGLRLRARHAAAQAVVSPAPPQPTTTPSADSVATVPNGLRPDDAAKNKAGSAPAAAPAAISVDDLPRAAGPKAPKNRQGQKPLTPR